MAGLEIRNVSKRFGATRALDDVSLSVKSGEFIALLGPSGCGKTTLLRLLAGFEPVDNGEIVLDGQPLSSPAHHIATEERGIGMVFQSYALWPHMTVAENVEFSLKVRRIAGPKRREIVADSLAAVGLGDMGSRSPSTLSGGQRQRVALARCLAMQPRLVLLDEPLANLDVHLRDSMQEEFRTFHDRTGAMMVYVTHDQAEALALADRIAVMSHGKILQDASGPDLYRRPANAEVARFIGRGMVLPCTVKRVEPANSPHDGHCEAEILSATVRLRCGATARPGPAEACLRTEDLRLAPLNGSTDTLPARVSRVVFQGAVALVETRLEAAAEPALRVAVSPLDAPSAGSRVSVQIGDGWLLPA